MQLRVQALGLVMGQCLWRSIVLLQKGKKGKGKDKGKESKGKGKQGKDSKGKGKQGKDKGHDKSKPGDKRVASDKCLYCGKSGIGRETAESTRPMSRPARCKLSPRMQLPVSRQ